MSENAKESGHYHELEPEKRSVYGCGVGYSSAGGKMAFCIALRT